MVGKTTIQYIYDLDVSFRIGRNVDPGVAEIYTADGIKFTGVGDYFINWVVREQ